MTTFVKKEKEPSAMAGENVASDGSTAEQGGSGTKEMSAYKHINI